MRIYNAERQPYGGYTDYRHIPELCRDGGPDDPAADSAEAMQERDARLWGLAGRVWAGTATRADVTSEPLTVLHALRASKPGLTWVKCSAFYVRLLADGEEPPGGRTLADALCEYLEV